MKVIILAGGKGTRLPISAKNIPKVLVEVDRRSILKHQIETLENQGFSDIRLSLGYKAEQIIEYLDKEFGKKYEYVVEKEPLGTGGAIKFASKGIEDDFMVINGDVLSDLNLKSFCDFHNALKIKKETNNFNSMALWHCQDSRSFGLIKVIEDKIIDFLEKPKEKTAGLINAGFYIFSPDVFKSISKTVFSVENEIFPDLARNGRMRGFIHKGSWADVGTEDRLECARTVVSKY